ncbi:MAG: hypothetical protein R3Y28_04865 [Candidatus Gastranaerophilales bacterium]
MIKLFDEKFKVDSITEIYGIANVREDKYFEGLTEFSLSNVFQVKKLLSNNNNIFIAVSVNPIKNGQKNGKIKEIIKLTGYKQTGEVKLNHNNTETTGYCIAYCQPIINFGNIAQNRLYFNIRPHGQYLIKQLFPAQSDNILNYINQNLEDSNG